MEDKEIYKILKNFSFSEQETSVYLSVLKIGKASVTEISRKTNMGRTAAYFHIKNLVDKGYFKKIKGHDKYRYTAETPDELLKNIEGHVSRFKRILPELENINKLDKETPLIEVKESLPALLKIYDDISNLPPNAEFRVIEGVKAIEGEIKMLKNKKLSDFFKGIKKNKISTRAIFTEESLKITSKNFTKEEKEIMKDREWMVSTLPQNLLPFDELIYMYGNIIAFMFPDSSTVVFIKHRRIFQAMKAIFDSLHYFAKSEPHPWD